jgi:cardiolipin synthase
VAVFDGRLACVGSSNIDPFSLLLAREANIFVDDAAFAAGLRASLREAIERGAEPVPPRHWERQSVVSRARIWIAFHVVRLLIAFAAYERYR